MLQKIIISARYTDKPGQYFKFQNESAAHFQKVGAARSTNFKSRERSRRCAFSVAVWWLFDIRLLFDRQSQISNCSTHTTLAPDAIARD
ncbi:MAG: hypothetical protein HC849_08440 [Oscillatoriales cyanobacterium RU_3_3]|nr:hypothetical protein [Microcoleus sp. SU_5_6]NJM60196.1 hypothetical protein [Oscillatoriales cyanobacterium RU_3_3]